MANAGERLQVLLTTKNEISSELKQVKSDMNALGRTSADLNRRMESGETGLQGEYEQTRRELEKNRLKQIELGRAASRTNSDIRKMTTDATAGAKRMDRSFDGVNRSIGKTHTASQKLTAGWGKAMGVMAAVTAAVGATAGAFRLFTDSINEARGARKAMAQTAAVMRSMGRTEAPERVNRMIDQLEQMSGIDGDNLREMTNILFTFGNVTGDTFEKANRLALDVSVAFGKDLASSAVMVGKALNDPAKGLTSLTRIGVSFTDQQTEQVKAMMEVGDIAGAQKIILAELTRQVGGSAKAQADALDKTNVAWGNLKEAVGEVLMSTGTGIGLTEMLQDATRWIKKHQKDIISVLQKIMSVVFKLISVFLKWQSVVIGVLGYVVGAFAKVLHWMSLLDPRFKGAAENADSLARGFGNASDAANTASRYFDGLATKSDQASRKTKLLADALRNVKIPKDLRQAIETVTGGFVGLGVGAPVPGLFAGGPVTAGMTALVGEIGPELFVPTVGAPRIVGADGPEIRDFHTSGTVIPNHLLVPTITLAAPAATVPATPGVQIGEVHVHDRVDLQREMDSFMARQRRIAAERS